MAASVKTPNESHFHCEECSDEAIQTDWVIRSTRPLWIASLRWQ
jgi:hypothetical protein